MENLTVKALREYDDGPLTPDRENNQPEDYPDEDPELNNQHDGNYFKKNLRKIPKLRNITDF